MKFGKICHLGIIVPDVEKAVKIYEEVLGIGPWVIGDSSPFFDDKIVNGKPGMYVRNAVFTGEGYEIELIMPLTDDGVYAEWLRDKGPGLHHIKFETNDSHDEICSQIEAASGRKPYLHVEWPDGRTLVDYADLLRECGLLIEVN